MEGEAIGAAGSHAQRQAVQSSGPCAGRPPRRRIAPPSRPARRSPPGTASAAFSNLRPRLPSICAGPRGGEPRRPVERPMQGAQQDVVLPSPPASGAGRALDQPGGADDQQHFAEQAVVARTGRRLGPGIDAHVHILAVEVGGLVRRRDLHVDAGVLRVKARQARHQPAQGKGRRQLQAQAPVLGGSASPAASPTRSGRARSAPGGNRRCPCGVSSMPRCTRRNSLTSSQSSRPATWRLTAPCETLSSLAALVKLALRAAVSKARTEFRGGKPSGHALPSNFLMESMS